VKPAGDENKEYVPENVTQAGAAPPLENPSAKDAPSDSPKLDPAVAAEKFHELIFVLNCLSLKGDPRPLVESVKSSISGSAFKAIDIYTWDKYVQVAKDQAVVDIGDGRDGTWVGLRPAFRRGNEYAFGALVEVLKCAGKKRVPRTEACDMLLEREGDDFFERYDFDRWRRFAAEAAEAGYVFLGERRGTPYVALCASVL